MVKRKSKARQIIPTKIWTFFQKKLLNFFKHFLPGRFYDRTFAVLAHDVFMSSLSLPLALWIRVGNDINAYAPSLIIKHSLIIGLLSLSLFLWLQLYRGVWRYVSLKELMAIALAVSCVTLTYLPLMFLMNHPLPLPRSVVVILWFLMIAFLGGSRLAYRIFQSRLETEDENNISHIPQSRVLLLGVNNQTEMFIREVDRNSGARYDIIGVIDEKHHDIGRYIHGIEVLGSINDLPKIVEHLNASGMHPHHLIITDLHFRGVKLQKLLEICSNLKVDIARLPKLTDLHKHNPSQVDIQPIAVDDLLGRTPVTLDRNSMKNFISKRRILVTGAGGSIGGELVRQIASFQPARIILIDHSEFSLYQINLELSEQYPHLSFKSILADVSDANRIEQIFRNEHPEIIFHAAALKHVPIAEENPSETVLTNVIGTRNIAQAAIEIKAKSVVFISTDKAVNPSSLMGTTKRLSEILCQSLDSLNTTKSGTRFIVTRFGNVLGSTGSVVPLFKRQLSRGGPITVTDPRITRYFMTIHEAVELVLQAATLGYKTPKSTGQIFVLEMGESINISELAKQMIRLVGLKPGEDIMIEYTGLRPGEKLHEELFFQEENLIPTSCKGLMLATTNLTELDRLLPAIHELEKIARRHQETELISHLTKLVPEYQNPQRASNRNKAGEVREPQP